MGLPRLYWTASHPKNLESSNVVCKVCEIAGCQEVETFDGSLGPSWADLIPKCNPKVIKNVNPTQQTYCVLFMLVVLAFCILFDLRCFSCVLLRRAALHYVVLVCVALCCVLCLFVYLITPLPTY